ncbi:MAG TPA: WYL domain-containing protein [Beutenbergiaceae bacterium]|nr:WYL domain-containing protein [Beutenbergiaceae bacterium]
MSARLDAAERLLALVIALSHTPHRMTKAQIRANVAGYADASSDAAFERMFERDKDALRALGVPLTTVTDSTHEDDVGYRIDTSEYALPAVDFTPAEIGVLSLAAEVWQDSSLAAQARRGLTKLRATTPHAQDLEPATALRVRGPGDVFETLLEAIMARQPVRFDYRAASTGSTARRTVEPWRLYAKDRGWYLVGFDRDRQAERHFRLSRIIGRARRTGEAGEVALPEGMPPTTAAAHRTRVRLAVLPGRAAALRARAVGEPAHDTAANGGPRRDIVELDTADPDLLAEEIAGYGAAVVVLHPPEVRDNVLRRLHAVAELAAIGVRGEG